MFTLSNNAHTTTYVITNCKEAETSLAIKHHKDMMSDQDTASVIWHTVAHVQYLDMCHKIDTLTLHIYLRMCE